MRFANLKMSIFFFVLAMLLMAPQSQAADWGCPAWGNAYMWQMNPEQMEMAREIIGRNFANMDSTRQALGAKRQELDSLLASPNPDPGRIESLSREIGELRGKMLSARSQIRSQLAQKGLSPDFLGPDAPERPDNFGGPQGYHHNRPRHGGWGHGRGHGGPYGCGCW